jgi:ribose transport system substrate-binding protein
MHRLTRRTFVKRSALATSACWVGGSFFTSCSRQDSATQVDAAATVQPGEPLVSLFTTLADEYFTSHVAGTKQCAEALGLTYEGFTNNNRPEVELSQFETAAGRGIRMITVIPPDFSNVPALFRRANEMKVHTVTSAEMPPWYFPHEDGEYAVSFITPFDYDSFYDVCKLLITHIGGSGKVIMITGFPGGTPDTLRTAAAKKVIEEHPGVTLLGHLPGKWNRVDGRRATEDLMTVHPDFDAVIALNDEMAIGALSALEDAGRKNVPITGHNGTAEIMSYIEEGKVFATSSTFPFWIGAYMVAVAYDAANGWKPSLPERMMISRHAVIDRSNVDVYVSRYAANIDALPFDFKKMSKTLHPDDWDPQNLLTPLDVNTYFGHTPPQSDTPIPEDWLQAMNSGEMERVAEIYKTRYKKQILG